MISGNLGKLPLGKPINPAVSQITDIRFFFSKSKHRHSSSHGTDPLFPTIITYSLIHILTGFRKKKFWCFTKHPLIFPIKMLQAVRSKPGSHFPLALPSHAVKNSHYRKALPKPDTCTDFFCSMITHWKVLSAAPEIVLVIWSHFPCMAGICIINMICHSIPLRLSVDIPKNHSHFLYDRYHHSSNCSSAFFQYFSPRLVYSVLSFSLSWTVPSVSIQRISLPRLS